MSKDPREYPRQIKESWAVHQALRGLGFQAEDIYVTCGRDGQRPFSPDSFFVFLRTQGREFIVNAGVCENSEEAESLLGVWKEFSTLFNDQVFDDELMKEIYNESHVMRNKTGLIVALMNQGIRCPMMMN